LKPAWSFSTADVRRAAVAEVRVPIASDADTVVARQRGREVALGVGLSRTDATFVATAISEIARNITTHAGKGEIIIGELIDDERRGIVVVARDNGPGIGDVPAVLRREFSPAAKGLGAGLWGAQRLMDEIEVVSEVGSGTTVTMKKWRGVDEVAALLDKSR
jgi:serine/threonine-protein kinase RsbT